MSEYRHKFEGNNAHQPSQRPRGRVNTSDGSLPPQASQPRPAQSSSSNKSTKGQTSSKG